MLRAWRVGNVFGIGIYIHWSLLLLPFIVGFLHWSHGESEIALLVTLLIPPVFGCVLLHELGHALMAKWFGILTRDITLYPIGGVARLERIIGSPWEEFWISLAGPAVNVVIAILVWILIPILDISLQPQLQDYSLGEGLIAGLFFSNVTLVLFNMLPAFPMDGGRVLRAFLSLGIGRLAATEVAAFLGMILAGLLVFHPIFSLVLAVLFGGPLGFNPLLSLVGLFVFFAGQQELAVVRYLEGREEGPLDVLPVIPSAISPSAIPAEPAFTGFTWDRKAHVWIEWRLGQPIRASWGQVARQTHPQ